MRATDGGVEASTLEANVDPDAAAPAKNSGALCGASGRNDCGQFAVCNPELGCVECVSDDECPATATHCLHGACVGCRPSTESAEPNDAGLPEVPDCPGKENACWTSDYECHAACTNDASCPSGTTCDVLSGACVGCTTDAACSSGVCSPVLRRCVECVTNDRCPAQRPRCRALTNTCVACTSNDDCGRSEPICDPATFTCRVGCSSDAMCSAGSKCDLVTASCFVPVVVPPADSGAPTDADAGASDAGN